MNFIKRCAECQRLWRTHSITVVEHIKLEDKLQVAAAALEPARVTELEVRVASAAQQRTNARQAILALST